MPERIIRIPENSGSSPKWGLNSEGRDKRDANHRLEMTKKITKIVAALRDPEVASYIGDRIVYQMEREVDTAIARARVRNELNLETGQ
ncbi:MAG TPA: hypothetical protein VJH06_01250 [Candidatus Paceibacterota bacterium]